MFKDIEYIVTHKGRYHASAVKQQTTIAYLRVGVQVNDQPRTNIASECSTVIVYVDCVTVQQSVTSVIPVCERLWVIA